MTLFGFALLADENINPLVVASLRLLGCDITTVAELGLAGSPDQAILERSDLTFPSYSPSSTRRAAFESGSDSYPCTTSLGTPLNADLKRLVHDRLAAEDL